MTWGTAPDMVAGVAESVPDPSTEGHERALVYMGLQAGTPIQEIALDRVFIGSCTNSRIGDLRVAAEVVKGRTVASTVSAMVVPGSAQVKAQAEREGLDEIFRAAGFDWRGAGCSMCLGMNPDTLEPGERCASTSNRNFEGRQGRGGRTHLVSPQMAAAAAIEGRFVDIRELELIMEAIKTISGAVSVLNRNDVDTDQIMPKQFLKRVERTGFGEFLFYDWAKEPGWDLPRNPILVTGRNFGCGSSREHAPWGLQDYGFTAIVAPSFADIFKSNCTKIGLLPIELTEAEVKALMQAGEAEIDLEAQEVRFGDTVARFEIDPETKHRLFNGLDDIALTLAQDDAICRLRARARARRAGHDGADMSGAGSRLGREHLPPRLGPAGRNGRAAVLDRLELRGDETVLDAGCGSGRVTRAAARAPAARARHRGRRLAGHGRPRARGARPASADVREADLADAAPRRRRARSTRCSPTRPFTGCADHDALFARAGRGDAARRPRSARSAAARATSPQVHAQALAAGADAGLERPLRRLAAARGTSRRPQQTEAPPARGRLRRACAAGCRRGPSNPTSHARTCRPSASDRTSSVSRPTSTSASSTP